MDHRSITPVQNQEKALTKHNVDTGTSGALSSLYQTHDLQSELAFRFAKCIIARDRVRAGCWYIIIFSNCKFRIKHHIHTLESSQKEYPWADHSQCFLCSSLCSSMQLTTYFYPVFLCFRYVSKNNHVEHGSKRERERKNAWLTKDVLSPGQPF